MFLTTHAAASIFIGQYLPSPILGFFAALGFHFILDAIPHGDNVLFERIHKNPQDSFVLRYIFADILALFALVLFFHLREKLYNFVIIASLFGGLLPDIFVTLHHKVEERFRQILKERKTTGRQLLEKHNLFHQFLSRHERFHHFIHSLILKKPLSLREGLVIQAVMAIIFIYLAL